MEPGDLLHEHQSLVVGARRAKNDTSRRVIPLPAFIYKQLKSYLDDKSKWRTDRFPWSRDRNVVAKSIRHVLRWSTELTGNDLFKMMPPMDLRKTLTNELDGKVGDLVMMAYYGHAVKGTMAKHYKSLRALPNDAPQILKRSLDNLRGTVVAEIEKSCRGLSF
jgi:hypothetical protein